MEEYERQRAILLEEIGATLGGRRGVSGLAPHDATQLLTLRALNLLLRSQAAAAPGKGVLVGECLVQTPQAGLKPVIQTDGGKLEWWCVHAKRHTSTC